MVGVASPAIKLPIVRMLRVEPTLLAGVLSVVHLLVGVDCPLDRFRFDLALERTEKSG